MNIDINTLEKRFDFELYDKISQYMDYELEQSISLEFDIFEENLYVEFDVFFSYDHKDDSVEVTIIDMAKIGNSEYEIEKEINIIL